MLAHIGLHGKLQRFLLIILCVILVNVVLALDTGTGGRSTGVRSQCLCNAHAIGVVHNKIGVDRLAVLHLVALALDTEVVADLTLLAVQPVEQPNGSFNILALRGDGGRSTGLVIDVVHLGELSVLTLGRGDGRSSLNVIFLEVGIGLHHSLRIVAEALTERCVAQDAVACDKISLGGLLISLHPVVVQQTFGIPVGHLLDEILAAVLNEAVLHDTVIYIEVAPVIVSGRPDIFNPLFTGRERLAVAGCLSCAQDFFPLVNRLGRLIKAQIRQRVGSIQETGRKFGLVGGFQTAQTGEAVIVAAGRLDHLTDFRMFLHDFGQVCSICHIVIQRNDDAIIDGCTRTARISCPCILNDVGILAGGQHYGKFFGLRALRRVLEFDGNAGPFLDILGPRRIAKVCVVVGDIAVQCGVPGQRSTCKGFVAVRGCFRLGGCRRCSFCRGCCRRGCRTAAACQRSADHCG